MAFGWAIEADFLAKDFFIFHNCLLTTHFLKTNDLQIIFLLCQFHHFRILWIYSGVSEADGRHNKEYRKIYVDFSCNSSALCLESNLSEGSGNRVIMYDPLDWPEDGLRSV